MVTARQWTLGVVPVWPCRRRPSEERGEGVAGEDEDEDEDRSADEECTGRVYPNNARRAIFFSAESCAAS